MDSFGKKLKELTDKFSTCAQLSLYDDEGEKEALRLAHALIDIEESFREIYEGFYLKLDKAQDEEKIIDILLDIRMCFEHIAYHLNDSKFIREGLYKLGD